MAKLVQSPPKYLPKEWHASNHLNYSKAEKERAASERLRAECERLRRETEATTVRTQRNIEHKLSQRLRDINFWKEELENKLANNAEETKLLLERKEQLEKALMSTQFPLEVASSCLGYREKRIGPDMVHDDVEIGLVKVRALYLHFHRCNSYGCHKTVCMMQCHTLQSSVVSMIIHFQCQ